MPLNAIPDTATTGGTRHRCPLTTCDWDYEEPPVQDWPTADPGLTAADTESHFESDPRAAVVFATVLVALKDTEEKLREHFDTHPFDEWVLEVVHLREDLQRLNAGGPGPMWVRPSAERIDNAVEAMADRVRAIRALNDLSAEDPGHWQPSKFTRRQWTTSANTILRADARWRANHPETPA